MPDTLDFTLLGQPSPWLAEQIRPPLLLRHTATPEDITDTPALIVLNPEQPEQQLAWLRRLRASASLGGVPMLSLQPEERQDAESRILLDGGWHSLPHAEDLARDWQRRMDLFHLRHPDAAIQQVLAYLWPREQKRLLPLCDWQAPQLYRYPLLDCISGNTEEAALLLHRLRTRKLVLPDQLVDRVRSCPACHGSHLSYVEQCPTCQSLDIEQQPSIHCFCCGHVARQEDFRRHGVLECPNCHTRLRHIGSDYDRPMENFHCKRCDELFIEPEVRARCMQCTSNHEPDKLRVEPINSYQLGEQGRLLSRHGELMADLAELSTIDLIPTELFRFTLRWLDQLAARYPEQGYSLLTLRLANVAEVVEQRGYNRTMQIITALAERLRAQLRSTDLVTRTADDLYWLLLPNTPEQGIATLEDKIRNTLAQHQEEGTATLRVELARYSAPRQGHRVQDTSLLMDTLVNEVSD